MADPGADALDAVLAALGAACSVCREDFPAPEDGEMCRNADVELENLKRFFSQIHLNAKQVGMERSASDDLGSMILAVGL